MEQEKISIMEETRFDKFKSVYEASLAGIESILKDISMGKKTNVNEMYKLVINCIATLGRASDLLPFLKYMPDRHPHVFSHSLNVALIGYMIVRGLKWDAERMQELILSGVMHDVGMLQVDDAIINKKGALTKAEIEDINWHTFNGYYILQGVETSERIRLVALTHHIRLDGSGYPNDIKKDEVNEYSRAISIADTYEAMTSKRSYRSAISPFEALREFQLSGFGTMDPNIMFPFLNYAANCYVGSKVLLSNGQVGEVVLINQIKFNCPLVKCGETFIDLAERQDIKIIQLAPKRDN